MADQYINQLNNYPDNTDGYVAVGSVNGNGGGKKLLSKIIPNTTTATSGQALTLNSQKQPVWSNLIPPIPYDAEEENYVLGIVNGKPEWVKLKNKRDEDESTYFIIYDDGSEPEPEDDEND